MQCATLGQGLQKFLEMKLVSPGGMCLYNKIIHTMKHDRNQQDHELIPDRDAE